MDCVKSCDGTHRGFPTRGRASYSKQRGVGFHVAVLQVHVAPRCTIMLLLSAAQQLVLRGADARHAAIPLRSASCCARLSVDDTIRNVLLEAEHAGASEAVRMWLDRITDEFIPALGVRIDAAADANDDFTAEWAILQALEDVREVDGLLDTCWRRFDGIVDEDEEAFVDMHDLPGHTARPSEGSRASAYGEVTRAGARQLFVEMGLPDAKACCFVDLGSGVGRLVAQAWLEQGVDRAIGVELAPTRHAAALRAWSRLRESGSALVRPQGAPEFVLCSMLETDLSCATHVYVASLCMSDELLDQLWVRLRAEAPALEVVATLRAFRAAPLRPEDRSEIETSSAEIEMRSAEIEMTWTPKGGRGTPVFVYQMQARMESANG